VGKWSRLNGIEWQIEGMNVMLARLLVLILFLAPAASAEAGFFFYASPYRDGPWQGPACDAPQVLSAIERRFARVETAYWEGARIVGIDHVREDATRDWQPTVIARRYCSARATLSDGNNHELVYWLRSDQGFAGIGWGVQYCLVGRDRFMTYAPACAVLRPKY